MSTSPAKRKALRPEVLSGTLSSTSVKDASVGSAGEELRSMSRNSGQPNLGDCPELREKEKTDTRRKAPSVEMNRVQV